MQASLSIRNKSAKQVLCSGAKADSKWPLLSETKSAIGERVEVFCQSTARWRLSTAFPAEVVSETLRLSQRRLFEKKV
jgi:hypothetical protein